MSTAPAGTSSQRFLRRTSFRECEYHTNFRKIDRDIISALVSDEASSVTGQMSKVYLSLVNAPAEYWEREGVLRLMGEEQEGRNRTAWEQLVSLVGVASATARKALQWMSEQAIIGYYAGKNGVGIRIFMNHAYSSIGNRPPSGQKNLRLVRTSSSVAPASFSEVAFNDSFAVSEVSDSDLKSRAPKNGAESERLDKKSPDLAPPAPCHHSHDLIPLEGMTMQLRAELEPAIQLAVRQATAREHERTREWLESRGLPKAARVAQHEAYNVLRKHGVISDSARTSRAQADIGRSQYTASEPHPLSSGEIDELAEACIALLEGKGQSIEVTLSEMSAEAGGLLLAEDAPHVRAKAGALLIAKGSAR